jgi:hypothetical protein
MRRYRSNRLDCDRHLWFRDAVVMMPPTSLSAEQFSVGQLCKMCARRLRRHSRDSRQLSCWPRFPSDERDQHRDAAAVCQQHGDTGDGMFGKHKMSINVVRKEYFTLK